MNRIIAILICLLFLIGCAGQRQPQVVYYDIEEYTERWSLDCAFTPTFILISAFATSLTKREFNTTFSHLDISQCVISSIIPPKTIASEILSANAEYRLWLDCPIGSYVSWNNNAFYADENNSDKILAGNYIENAAKQTSSHAPELIEYIANPIGGHKTEATIKKYMAGLFEESSNTDANRVISRFSATIVRFRK